MKWSLFALLIGFGIDLIVGDPHGLPHPVVGIGKLISLLERRFRALFPRTARGEMFAGACIWLCTVLVSAGLPVLILYGAQRVSVYLRLVLESVMCWQVLAVRSLREESMRVYAALQTGSLSAAQQAVSMIVGRDTARLDAAGVTRAAVETVAENTSDGVIAPMLYTALGGPVLGFLYKAVNTMDSMVGYKNDRYLHFGRAAAKLDDVVNFFPARISAFLMIGAAFLSGKSYNGRQAWRIWRRDSRKHASPNSAQTESVCAGALGIQLAGDASYFGKVVKKPYIGDPKRQVEYEDIRRANRLMNRTAWICELLCLGILTWVAAGCGWL